MRWNKRAGADSCCFGGATAAVAKAPENPVGNSKNTHVNTNGIHFLFIKPFNSYAIFFFLPPKLVVSIFSRRDVSGPERGNPLHSFTGKYLFIFFFLHSSFSIFFNPYLQIPHISWENI